MKKNNVSGIATAKVVLSDAAKKLKNNGVKTKRSALSGKNFDTLKAAEKDVLLKSILEHLGWVDETGTIY